MSCNVKLSVIIANYNSASILPQALDSVFLQTCADFEVIVIDGCSTDDTVAVIKRYKNKSIRYLVEEDSGIYDAMNKGVSLAKGDWILFMGADDRLHDKDVIMEMVGSEKGDRKYDVVIGDIQFDNNKIRKSSVSARTQYINTVHHQSAFYRRELFAAFKYNDTYKVSADYELNLLVFLKRIKVLKVDRVVCIVGLGGVSNTVNFGGYAEEIQIRNKYLKRGPLRMGMNCITWMRYIVKKIAMLIGIHVHYYK